MLRPAPPMPATKVWLKMTLVVERLALAFMQVLCTVIMGWYVLHHPDIRWSGEQDLANDPKLASLTENYLNIREERIRNIAFNANATDGGEIEPMRKPLFFYLILSEMLLPYNLQVVMVGIGSATYDQIEYDLAFTMEVYLISVHL